MQASAMTHPDHIIQFFKGDEFASRSIVAFLCEGMRRGEAAACIAREELHDAIRRKLGREFSDLTAREAGGQFILLGSREIAARIAPGGMMDETLFRELASGLLERIGSCHSGFRVHGDIVDVLARQGRFEAAAKVESLWGELLDETSFPLL